MSKRSKLAACLIGGGLLLGGTGGCLPSNFFADLAATLLTTAVTAFFNEFLQMLLSAATTT